MGKQYARSASHPCLPSTPVDHGEPTGCAGERGEALFNWSSLDWSALYVSHFKHHVWSACNVGIDQGSLPEKNVQVPLMGKIYSLAYETLIFIAPFESPLLGELIRSYRTCKARLDAQANDTTSPGSKAEDYQAWNPDTYLDHYQAVKVLIEKPWFKRAWVVQEFVLSQRHKFIVAEECLEIDSLSEFVWEFYNLAITAHGLGKFRDIKFHGINNLYGSSDENAEQHL